MKFTYYYKKSDGIRREGTVEAESRDVAFFELRKVGIRPIKMMVDDGAKENGAPRPDGWGVRLVGVALVVVALSVGIHVWMGVRSSPLPPPQMDVSGRGSKIGMAHAVRVAKPRPRRWLGHDREFLYDKIFPRSSEAYLARFAEPGYLPRGGIPAMTSDVKEDLFDCLADDIALEDGDDESVVALKRIVAGLKQDVEMMLGTGMSVEDVMARFCARQQMEIEHRAKVAQEVASGRMTLSDANAGLAAMGVQELGKAAKAEPQP